MGDHSSFGPRSRFFPHHRPEYSNTSAQFPFLKDSIPDHFETAAEFVIRHWPNSVLELLAPTCRFSGPDVQFAEIDLRSLESAAETALA